MLLRKLIIVFFSKDSIHKHVISKITPTNGVRPFSAVSPPKMGTHHQKIKRFKRFNRNPRVLTRSASSGPRSQTQIHPGSPNISTRPSGLKLDSQTNIIPFHQNQTPVPTKTQLTVHPKHLVTLRLPWRKNAF